MKEYIKPTFEYVQLSIEERMACSNYKPIIIGDWIHCWDWLTGWHYVRNKQGKQGKQSRGDRWGR